MSDTRFTLDTPFGENTRQAFLAITLSLLMLGSLVPAGAAASISETDTNAQADLHVSTPDETLEVGNTTNATVSAAGADNGVSAYNLTVGVNDPSVATLENATIHTGDTDDGNEALKNVTFNDDQSEVTVSVALLDETHAPSDEIDLFDVELEGHADGETKLEIRDVTELADIDHESYEIQTVASDELTVGDETLTAETAVSAPDELEVGDTANATVSALDATDGVSAYNLTLAVDNASVATLENATATAEGDEGPLVNTTRSDDGSTLTVTAALLNATHEPAEEIDLLNVELEGQAEGAAELEIRDVAELTTLETESYDVSHEDVDSFDVMESSADPAPSPDPEEPFFDVDIVQDQTPDEITAGEAVVVNAAVENTGEADGEQNVSLLADSASVDTKSVALASNETEDVSLTWNTSEDDAGTYDLTVETEDADAATQLEVAEPLEDAYFDIAVNHDPADVTAGETAAVNTTVQNTGDKEAATNVTVFLEDEPVATESVSLAGDETEHVVPEWETSEDDSGTYNLTVETDDTKDETTLTVTEPPEPFFDVVIDQTPDAITASENATVNATIENTGEADGSQDVGLYDDDTTLDAQHVELASNETTDVSLTWETSEDDAGTYDLAVETANDTATTQLEVIEPAHFAVDLEVNETIGQGEELAIDAIVENTGDEKATQTVTLESSEYGETVSDEITLEGGDSEPVNTTVTIPADATLGELLIEAETEDDTDTQTVDIVSNTDYTVEITDTTAPVTAGETIKVDALIENEGIGVHEQSVAFTVGSETVDNQSIELEEDETKPVTFEYETADDDTPGVSLGVSTDDDIETTTERVREAQPATFEVSDLDVPDTATQGETVTATATIENVGDRTGDDIVELYFDGDSVNETNAELEAGEPVEIDLEHEVASEPRAGEHAVDIAVATDDDVSFDDLAVDYGDIESGLEAVESGGTVTIADGEYEETVSIDTADVTLETAGAAHDPVVVPADDVAADIAAENVTITGLTFADNGDATALTVTEPGADIVRNTFVDLETGIELRSDESHVAHNHFEGSVETAIDVVNSDANTIENNVIETGASESVTVSTSTTTATNGILFSDGADNTVVSMNDISVTGDAIRIAADSGTENTANENNLEGDNQSVVNNLEAAEMSAATTSESVAFESFANYYGAGGLEENTEGAVEDDEEVEEPYETATYNVTIEETPDSVTVGDELTVEAAIENAGDYNGSQDVGLDLGDEEAVTAETDVEIEANTTDQINLTYTPEQTDINDSATLTVTTDDDAATDTVDVVAEPEFVVSDLEAPSEATAGDTIEANATVENKGGPATQDVELRLGDESLEDESLQLNESEEKAVNFTTTLSDEYDDEITTLAVASDQSKADAAFQLHAAEPLFDVTIDQAPDEVTAGEKVDVDLTVENIGETVGDQTVRLSVDGTDLADSEQLELDSGATEPLTLTWDTEDVDADLYDLDVETEDTTDTTSIAVVEPDTPFFDVAIDEDATDDTVEPGEELAVTALVTNTGGLEETQPIEFDVGDSGVDDTAERTLEAGEENEITFTYTVAEDIEADTIPITVESANDSATHTVTVESGEAGGGLPAFPEPSDDASVSIGHIDAPSEVEIGESVQVSALVGNHAEEPVSEHIILSLDGMTIDRETTTFEGSTETKVEYEFAAPDAAGEYEVTIETRDQSTSTTLTVIEEERLEEDESATEEPEADEPETDETETGTDDGDDDETVFEFSDGSPGFGILPALVALLGGGYLLRTRVR
ncbi:CARDB domain-containing protein [Natronorubrum sp. A-ect3]|uniref:CARDB domain-containing protein n=1 Tax=Natronorubrum sp. A-ect3 TaxID=3242698 RepID=UPI00359CFB68